MKLVFALVVISAIAIDAQINWCSVQKKTCDGKKHVGCGASGKPASNCHQIVQFTDEMKQQIVDLHNELRQQQASGLTPGLDTAARMATIQWDDNLAYVAYLNAATCKYGHDGCRNLPDWNNVGQNIAAGFVGGLPYQDPKDIIDSQTKAWFSEHANCDMDHINEFKFLTDPNKEIGHFTQVVRDNADRIGCYISQFNWPGKGYTNYLVCDYSNTNNICLAVYETGAPGSKCKTGTNPKYPALCSESEEYDHKTPVLQLQPGEPIPKCFQEQGK